MRWQLATPHSLQTNPFRSMKRLFLEKSIPIAFQLRSQGPSKEPTAGGFDEAVWESKEWCE